MIAMLPSLTYFSAYFGWAASNLRGLGLLAWLPAGFQTESRMWKADGRIILPSTEVVSGNGSIFNKGRVLNASIANRLRISRGFSGIGQVGTLLEPTRIELLADGKTVFDVATTGWVVNAGTPTYTANTDIAPDGTLTADSLEDNNSGVAEGIRHDTSIAADTVIRSISVFIKKTISATTFPLIGIVYTPTTRHGRVILNTNTGVATLELDTGGATTFGADSAGDYWRLWVAKANSDSNTNLRYIIFPAFSSNGTTIDVTAQGTNVFWGAQVEVGDFPSSYIIPAAATRANEDTRYDNTGQVFMKASEGSLIVVAVPDFDSTVSEDATIFDTRLASNADGLLFRFTEADNAYKLFVKSGGSTVATVVSTSGPSRGVPQVIMVTWEASNYKIYIDGVLEATTSSGAAPTTLASDFFLGIAKAGNVQWSGLLSNLIIFERVLTLRQIQDVAKTWIQPIYPGRLRLKA